MRGSFFHRGHYFAHHCMFVSIYRMQFASDSAITFNKKFECWKTSNYATGVIYFQFCAFEYRNTRKLNLNIKIKCVYFDIEMRRIENRLRQLRNYWLSSIQILLNVLPVYSDVCFSISWSTLIGSAWKHLNLKGSNPHQIFTKISPKAFGSLGGNAHLLHLSHPHWVSVQKLKLVVK